MEYKFTIEKTFSPLGSKTPPYIEYGVKRESLADNMKSLYHIGWHGWTSQNIQKLIDDTLALQGDDYFDYFVEGSELRISIDNEFVLFFDWRTDNIDEDFRISTTDFVTFMQDFKKFVEENS